MFIIASVVATIIIILIISISIMHGDVELYNRLTELPQIPCASKNEH